MLTSCRERAAKVPLIRQRVASSRETVNPDEQRQGKGSIGDRRSRYRFCLGADNSAGAFIPAMNHADARSGRAMCGYKQFQCAKVPITPIDRQRSVRRSVESQRGHILSYVYGESSIRRCEFKANFRSGSKKPRLEMNEAARAGTCNYIFHSNVPIARSRIADTVRGFPWDLNS